MSNIKIQIDDGKVRDILIPDSWYNAAWYDGTVISVDWIIGEIESSLSYMKEYCGINLDESQEDFQEGITEFRKEQAKYQKIRDDKWKDPEYSKKCWDMIRTDDNAVISKIIKDCAEKTIKELDAKVYETLINKEI